MSAQAYRFANGPARTPTVEGCCTRCKAPNEERPCTRFHGVCDECMTAYVQWGRAAGRCLLDGACIGALCELEAQGHTLATIDMIEPLVAPVAGVWFDLLYDGPGWVIGGVYGALDRLRREHGSVMKVRLGGGRVAYALAEGLRG